MQVPILPVDGRQSAMALAIPAAPGARSGGMASSSCRSGAARRATGRPCRARAAGAIWIVEIKSSIIDFQVDRKWPDYRAHCDRLLFAVAPDFPVEILPQDTGLIVADAYDGALLREAPEHRLSSPTRRALTLHIARVCAARLHQALDPDMAWEAFDRRLTAAPRRPMTGGPPARSEEAFPWT